MYPPLVPMSSTFDGDTFPAAGFVFGGAAGTTGATDELGVALATAVSVAGGAGTLADAAGVVALCGSSFFTGSVFVQPLVMDA
jgi:hypothetical protein